jgi:hypothetical protein
MRGKKITDEQKEKVKAVIYLNPQATHTDISRETGIPRPTIIDMLKDKAFIDKDKFDEARQLKKQEFIARAFDLAMQTLDVIVDKVKTFKDSPEALQKANIRDLTTALGTLYDKQALASGEPTIISDRPEPTPELLQELEEKVARLKQLTGS